MGIIKILNNIWVPQEIIDQLLINWETIDKTALVDIIESYIDKIESKTKELHCLIDEIKKNILKYEWDKNQISDNDDADDLLKWL